MELRRKLYTRGSSYETTIPAPILFSTDLDKKQEVVFRFDKKTNRWYLEVEQSSKRKKKKQR